MLETATFYTEVDRNHPTHYNAKSTTFRIMCVGMLSLLILYPIRG
jgi:hypothetical protein